MKHLHAYIIKPINGRYTNNKKVGESNLILNTSIEDHKFVNRIGIVVETPVNNSTLQKGDEVVVHHNTFRRYYNMRGQATNSSNYFKDDLFFCYIDQIFLYKRNNKWHAPEDYCFVKPIVENKKFSDQKEKPLIGVLIGFTPNSEYEFVIDNEKLYRVPINSIAIKYDRKGTEVEYNPSWL